MAKAVDLYYGTGDELKDQIAALDLLNRARVMNFGPAFKVLEEILPQPNILIG